MKPEKQRALEAAGFRIGSAADFLELTDEERRLVDLRLALGRSIRRLRETNGLTQQQLAARLKSSQSRVAKMEVAASDVSLDLMFRGLFAVGGKLSDVLRSTPMVSRTAAGTRRSPRKPRKKAGRPVGTHKG